MMFFQNNLKDLLGPKAVENQYAGSLLSTFLGLAVKYTLEALQTEVGVGISRFIARILPSRNRKGRPVASMEGCQPNNHRVQVPAVSANALDNSNRRSLHTRASIRPCVILTYEGFCRVKHQYVTPISDRIARSRDTLPITSNQCIILLAILLSWRFQSSAKPNHHRHSLCQVCDVLYKLQLLLWAEFLLIDCMAREILLVRI
jgi:hypothetical protein